MARSQEARSIDLPDDAIGRAQRQRVGRLVCRPVLRRCRLEALSPSPCGVGNRGIKNNEAAPAFIGRDFIVDIVMRFAAVHELLRRSLARNVVCERLGSVVAVGRQWYRGIADAAAQSVGIKLRSQNHPAIASSGH